MRKTRRYKHGLSYYNDPSALNGKTIFTKAITSVQISSKLPRSMPRTGQTVTTKKNFMASQVLDRQVRPGKYFIPYVIIVEY